MFSNGDFQHETFTRRNHLNAGLEMGENTLAQTRGLFRPKLLECLRGYTTAQFLADLAAGLAVGVLALPLAMAFAIASGVKPEAGIFTAIIAGFFISALGGSRVQIGGPTGAFVVIIYSVTQEFGPGGLIVCTMLAGVILFVMGLVRFGAVIKFIPHPLSVGFTTGIAVLILGTQVKDFFGLTVGSLPVSFAPKMQVLVTAWATWNGPTLVLAIGSVAVIAWWPRRLAKVFPGSAAALLAGALVVTLSDWGTHTGIATIGSQFGEFARAVPTIAWPIVDWSQLPNLFQPATTIALLIAMQALLCAVVTDGIVDDRHDSNQELMAQGIANFVAPLFGCIPATGAVARSISNARGGGRTPIAGMIHALVLFLLIMIVAPLLKYVPLACLSAVLVVAAYKMADWRQFMRLGKWPISDAAVFLLTFALTVLVNLTVAVEVGVVLAALLFMNRISQTTQIMAVDESTETEGSQHSLIGKEVPEGVLIFRVFGAFFFGAADKLETELNRAKQEPKVLILRMRKVLAMDATGLNALEDLYEKLQRQGGHLLLSGPHTQPYVMMEQAGFMDKLGRSNVCPHIGAALDRAREILGLPPAPPSDPLHAQKKEMEVARMEIANALERANRVLQTSANRPEGPRDS